SVPLRDTAFNYNHAPVIRHLPFFFYSYRHPRDLHSFPTRRSSDLIASEFVDGDFRAFLARHELVAEVRPHPGAFVDKLVPRKKGDRKSTRLNSSHRTISYAVFCLKKKKSRKRECESEYRALLR